MILTLYEPFRHWSENGSVYILSDLHFNDSDCKLMDPNWIKPEEQLEIINKMVFKNDTFICLGDVGDPKYVSMIKARKKILLLGNHDARGTYKNLFNEVYAGPLFISDKILLSHEPVYGLPWCLNIHGHDHNGVEAYCEGCKHINLAANVCKYTPINLGKLINDGILSDIDNIHRQTIDRAVEKKYKKLSDE
ncbi:MAG: metallophosphoesterase [Lachnospiraceae bacterium]|nr:metallophosphoesterase [Lachnospiraceae bacterium]